MNQVYCRNMQGEGRDEDSLGLQGLQHHSQVPVLGHPGTSLRLPDTRTASSTSSWSCLGRGARRERATACITGVTDLSPWW